MSERNSARRLCKENASFIIYLVISTSYLGVQMLQGLSYLDIGMYMSGCEHIADDASASVFLGQWLLSFVASSGVMRLLHADGFMALRVMYLVLTAVMQTMVYAYCRRYVPVRYVIAGLALTVLSLFGAYTEINYNDYTMLLVMLAILCYHRGMASGWGYMVLSGFLIGLSFYFRITNLAFIMLPLAAWLTGHVVRWGRYGFRYQALSFAAGWVLGIIATGLVVWLLGYGDVMAFTLRNIMTVGGNASDSHSLKNVIICFYEIHKTEVAATSVIVAVGWLCWSTLRHMAGLWRVLWLAVLSGVMVLCVYLWEHPSSITIGICLFGLALCLTDRAESAELKHLFALAMCLPVLAPLGSNAGAAFACKGTCMLALPMALYAFDRQWRHQCPLLTCREGRAAYRQTLRLCYAAVCCAMIYTNVLRPMMEDGNRLECRYRVDSPLTGPIMTTRHNADTHNYLLRRVKPMLADGEYLVSNGSLTAISLLGCRPYAVYSTVFSGDIMNSRYIDYAIAHTHRLPSILDDADAHTAKDLFVMRYIMSKGAYRAVWTDGRYTLWKPVGGSAVRR